jgi:AcrR family transcriptional regulator
VVAANQRDRLLDALVRTVAEKGYACARVTDICRAAGVTRPAFYALFEGKEDAFLAAHRYGTGVVIRMMEAAYAQAPEWCGGARAALQVLLEVLADAPAFAMMAVVEIEGVGPAGREVRQQLLRRFRQFFADAPCPPHPAAREQLVDAVVAGVYGSISRQVGMGRAAELPELLTDLGFFILAPFLGPAQAAAAIRAADAAAGGVATVPCAVPRS